MKNSFEKQKSRNPFKRVPWYGWVGAIVMLFLFMGLYKIAAVCAEKIFFNYGWGYCPKIDWIDNKIPFVPYFFIEIYVLAYGMWVVCPIILSTGSKKNFTNFMIYSIIAHFLTMLIFIAVPTYMIRANEPLLDVESIKTPITKFLMNLIVAGDGGQYGWNMAPSFHVLTSFLCMCGMFRQKDIHVGARVTYYVICPLIIAATVLVKQHYIFDIATGLAMGTCVYILVMLFKPGNIIVDKYPNFLVIKHKKKQLNKKAK